MIIKMNAQASYYHNNSKSSGTYGVSGSDINKKLGNSNSVASLVSQRFSQKQKATTYNKNQDMRDLLRGLDGNNKQKNNPYSATLASKVNGFLDTKSQYETKDKLNLKKYKYSYKQISSKILSAKTSVSAGQAVIAAKRKVIEVKRKLVANPKDADELQAALIHAERMEMAARKKKHNLEMEELVSNTMKRDDAMDKREELSEASKGATDNIIDQKQEEIFESEDEIFAERQEMIDGLREQMEESLSEISDEVIEELNQDIAEFGEEELKALEDQMQLMESMEIIDPHMSEEDFNKMKAKHRADEHKAIMKADMDYLKATVKNNLDGEVKAYSDAGASTTVPVPSIDMSL